MDDSPYHQLVLALLTVAYSDRRWPAGVNVAAGRLKASEFLWRRPYGSRMTALDRKADTRLSPNWKGLLCFLLGSMIH